MACWRRSTSAAVALATLLTGCGDPDSAPGHLAVTDARLTTSAGTTELVVELDHQFSEELLEALHAGVPIRYAWTLELLGSDEGMWRSTVADERGALEVVHRSFTGWYTVSDLRGDRQTPYPDIPETQRALARLRLPLTLDPAESDARGARFHIELDISALPPPLRLPAYLSSDWRLDSGWYQWTLGEPDRPADAGDSAP